MEEENEKLKSLNKRHAIGINNIIYVHDFIDEIWCDDDDTL